MTNNKFRKYVKEAIDNVDNAAYAALLDKRFLKNQTVSEIVTELNEEEGFSVSAEDVVKILEFARRSVRKELSKIAMTLPDPRDAWANEPNDD